MNYEEDKLPSPFYDSKEAYKERNVKEDEILAAVIETSTTVAEMQKRLYGQEQDEGDIPAIRNHLAQLNGTVREHDKEIPTLKDKVRRNWHWVLVSLAIATLASGLLELLRRL